MRFNIIAKTLGRRKQTTVQTTTREGENDGDFDKIPLSLPKLRIQKGDNASAFFLESNSSFMNAGPPTLKNLSASIPTAYRDRMGSNRSSLSRAPKRGSLGNLRKSNLGPDQNQQFLPFADQLSMADFEPIRVVGVGSFGRVTLSRVRATGQPVAIKKMSKFAILREQELAHTLGERAALAMLKSPFVVSLLASFQDAEHVFIVMDYVPGGELFSLCMEAGYLPESAARFYSAEAAEALNDFHSNGFVFRDLKPENTLIGSDGHVRLTDLGFVKRLPEGDKTYTLCGTPEYSAPEIILNQGHGCAADWWSLGVLLYEMVAGRAPFTADSLPALYSRILSGQYAPPPNASPACTDLIARLLNTDPARRLGAGGIGEVRAHPFFEGVDWEALRDKRVAPPFVPDLEGPFDSSFFGEYTDDEPLQTRLPGAGLTEQQQELFAEF